MELKALNYPSRYDCALCGAGLVAKVNYYKEFYGGAEVKTLWVGFDEVNALHCTDAGQSNVATMMLADQVKICAIYCPTCFLKYEMPQLAREREGEPANK